MQLAFVELFDVNNQTTGWVNVTSIASIVEMPDGSGTMVGGSFGNVTVQGTANEILDKIANVVNRVNDPDFDTA
ncbi:hypothetical protein [Mycobacterium phage GS4E]|nr:hypothetical protein [Mycobacterium phage GS4E]